MDQINRIVPASNITPAHTYGVDRDRKERPKQEQGEPKGPHRDVVQIHDEVVDVQLQEGSSDHHDVDISA